MKQQNLPTFLGHGGGAPINYNTGSWAGRPQLQNSQPTTKVQLCSASVWVTPRQTTWNYLLHSARAHVQCPNKPTSQIWKNVVGVTGAGLLDLARESDPSGGINKYQKGHTRKEMEH